MTRSVVWWRSAQWAGVLLTLVLLAGLVIQADLTLRILWYAVVPILPLVFVLQPTIWRNVCPLAAFNLLGADIARPPVRRLADSKWAAALGIVLLFALVPARRFLFNTDGLALAGVILVVAALAFALGLYADRKSGFCNAICPVLPVERLYGQAPLLKVQNIHCVECTTCTSAGCIDLAASKSIAQVLGAHRRSAKWVLTPFGAFACSFPGFVLGYFLIKDGAISTAPRVYGTVLLAALASYAVFASIGLLLELRFQQRGVRLMPVLGALPLVIYYWFTGSTVAAQWHLAGGFAIAVRTVAFITIAYWLFTQWPRVRTQPRPGRVGADLRFTT